MVKNILLAAVIVLLLLNAQTLIVGIYESDRNTDGWQWYTSDSRTHIVIGFNQEQWSAVLDTLDHSFSGYYYFDDSKYIPILVYLGERPSEGYEVDISRIVKENERTIITIARRSPEREQYVNTDPTYPYDYLLLKREQLINEEIIVQDQYGNILACYRQVFPGEERIYEEIVIFEYPMKEF